jgi:hypothetical protein
MSNTKCPVCRREYTRTGNAMRTKDHIMPRAWGGSLRYYGAGLVDRRNAQTVTVQHSDHPGETFTWADVRKVEYRVSHDGRPLWVLV